MKGRRYEPGHPVSTRKGIQNQDGRLCLFWRVLKTFRVHAYGYIIYPSSKICHCCGSVKKDLKLSDRIYKCSCGYVEDRDYNASLNLKDAETYVVA